MPETTDVLNAVWESLHSREESEALGWMSEKLLENGRLAFDTEDDARQWALKNTDLEEPETE